MSLLDGLKIEVSEVLAQRLAFIDEHDFSGVKRKVREELGKRGRVVDDEWLEAGVLALKQYYAITIMDGRNMHAISDALDPFWHEHMLHSEQYMTFCEKIMGRYLHHYPIDQAKPQNVELVDRIYQYTLRRYADCFIAIDGRFHTPNPPRDQHICAHNNDVDTELAIFPLMPEAQADMTAH